MGFPNIPIVQTDASMTQQAIGVDQSSYYNDQQYYQGNPNYYSGITTSQTDLYATQTPQAKLGIIKRTRNFCSLLLDAFGTGGLPDDPPLLEELGINFEHIKKKTVSALNPLAPIDAHIMDDSDLAGPLLYSMLFGSFLLFAGKAHFNYIYGFSLFGWLSMYLILNLMSDVGLDGYKTASVLGYCLLPIVLLSLISTIFQLTHYIGLGLAIASVLWSTYSASLMFVKVLSMHHQRLLVAYPVFLLYACFALLTVF